MVISLSGGRVEFLEETIISSSSSQTWLVLSEQLIENTIVQRIEFESLSVEIMMEIASLMEFIKKGRKTMQMRAKMKT